MTEHDKQKYTFRNRLPEDLNKFSHGAYDTLPIFQPSNGQIECGYNILAKRVKNSISSGTRVLMIDGFIGVEWSLLKNEIERYLNEYSVSADWYNMEKCLADENEIQKRIAPFLGGDDRIFGKHFPSGPEVFFDYSKIADYRIIASMKRAEKCGKIAIFYGIGAGLLELHDELWYVDFAKDYFQFKFRAGNIKNIGVSTELNFEDFYKRAYFVEWPALNRLKRQILPTIDLFIDGNNEENPTSISGDDFRATLAELASSPFRVRPWFYPGPWGGKYMQGHMKLDPEQPNFAWSFEAIVPENGITLEKNGHKLECSFDSLMFLQNENVLGIEASKQFKYEWPVRFDYLDTIDGGNLSAQVHPRLNYIQKEFGETYTQDETYYISVAKPDAKVYLGLTENCDPEEFKSALKSSLENEELLEIDKYINSEPSKPHDLFLIPNGTVHCSGKGNLVLEISATPYIFTFKIYDYLRRDLEGNLRPINIDRGFENIRFERKKQWVQENLIAKPNVIKEGNGWKEEVLYDKPYTFYNIHRVEFEQEYSFNTKGIAYTLNLVEGEQIEVISENGRITKLSFLETIIIPASAGQVHFNNLGDKPVKIVKVYVKEGVGNVLPVNDPIK